MLTGWLTHPTNQITEEDAIQRLRGVLSQCYNDLAAEPDATAIQGLSSECMTADELTCFVTMKTGTGFAPYVVILHCLSPYITGFGTTSQFQGKTFGFLGECVGAQLPPLIKEPPDGLSGPVRLTTSMVVPIPDKVHAHYANQDANTLMNAPTATTEKSFPKLLFMSNHSAPYFLAAQMPYKAFCM
jgi:hypothetical protein